MPRFSLRSLFFFCTAVAVLSAVTSHYAALGALLITAALLVLAELYADQITFWGARFVILILGAAAAFVFVFSLSIVIDDIRTFWLR